ncbi:sensor histidine kinase [Thalassotalea fusca]
MEINTGTVARWKQQILAFLVILIGVVVLVGWYTHVPALVQIHTTFVPMQYNTALGFLLSGIAVIALQNHYLKTAQACGSIVLVLGFFTLIQYIFTVNLGIDQLMMEHYITVKTSHPGRMAPNTALCFTLTGGGIITYLYCKAKIKMALLALIPAVLLTLSALAVFGYLYGVDTLYGWGKLTQMAIHTSVGFILLSISLFSLALAESQQQRMPKYQWIALTIVFTVIFTITLTWQAITINEFKKQQDMLERESHYFSTYLESNLQNFLQAMHRMADRVSNTKSTNLSLWHKDIQEYFNDFPFLAFININGVNNFKLQSQSPQWATQNPQLIHLINQAPSMYAKSPHLSVGLYPPFSPENNHYLGWLNVNAGQRSGYLNALIDYQLLMNEILEKAGLSNRLSLEVQLAQHLIYRSSDFIQDSSDELTQHSEFTILAYKISVTAKPTNDVLAQQSANLPILIAVIGLVFLFLLLWLIHLFQTQKEKHQLLKFNQRLKQEIDEKQAAQSELIKINNKLTSSNRDLEQFAFIASHDLKEPLRKVQAFGNLLAEEYAEKLDDDGQYYIQTMQNAAGRMSQLITDLLSFSRVSTRGQKAMLCDLHKIVSNVLNDMTIQIEEHQAKLSVEELPQIMADASQLSLVFQNLIANAIQFREPSRQLEIKISAKQTQHDWLISIADNGIGLDEKFSDKIFQIFQRLHNKHDIPGTGIGLAICRRILERHGGDISVKSTVGSGSCFTLKLPKSPNIEDNTNAL